MTDLNIYKAICPDCNVRLIVEGHETLILGEGRMSGQMVYRCPICKATFVHGCRGTGKLKPTRFLFFFPDTEVVPCDLRFETLTETE